MKSMILPLLVATATVLSARSENPPDELVKKLSAVIREHCPEAQITISNKLFTAKHGTMRFTLHGESKTGEVLPQTFQQEGPNLKGFVLTVSLGDGPYQGAAMVPQTLQGPYFPTFIDAPATEDGQNHYWVTFSYGSRLDEKLRNAILAALPRSVFQEKATNATNSSGVTDDSPISSPPVSTNSSPEAIATARERGAASAARDIRAGTLRILYFGKPWSLGKARVDDATGYRIQIVADCPVSEPFVSEVEAYNDAMRAWSELVAGVSVRMRADKTQWTTNETPTFQCDVRNQGQQGLLCFQSQEAGRLELDGVWYDWTGSYALKGSTFPPGREYRGIQVSLRSNWMHTLEWRDKTQSPPPQIPLRLLPGKHTIRFVPGVGDITAKPKPLPIYVPSNPVEIEVSAETAGSFGIYLLAEPVDQRRAAPGTEDWSHIRLSESPLISADDIISYDWRTHTMTLTEMGARRMPGTNLVGSFGKEFVIVADGQRCYRGAFWVSYSSVGYNGPIIDVALRGRDVQIQRAYPSAKFATADDPRPDKRIRQVLEALGKLTNGEPNAPVNGSQPIRAETAVGRPTAEIGVLDLNPPARVMGCLGKPLGTHMVIDGIFAENAMLANPLAVTRVDGQSLKETISIEIRGQLKTHKGVQYRLEGYESGGFAGAPEWFAPQAQQPFQYHSFFVFTEIIEPKPAKDGASIAPQSDPIEALAKELNSSPLWPNGEAPNISLSSNAAPAEVVARAVEMWGFDGGQIKTYQLLEVRPIGLDAKPGCFAALIESDLGRKILLFKYEQHAKTGLWWTRFYNAPEEAEPKHPANGSQPTRSETNRTSSAALPAEVVKASAAFKTGWPTRYPEDYAVSRAVLPWVRTGMTIKDVEGLLGPPDKESENRWFYTLFYSIFIEVRFAAEGTVVQVGSPLLTGRPTAGIGVLDLNPPARVMGYLGKPLGTHMVIDGIFAENAMLANPLAVARVDGQPLKETVSIEVPGKLKIHKGVQYRLEGYESGGFSGYPSWFAPQAQQPFQYHSFFVVTEIIEPVSARAGAVSSEWSAAQSSLQCALVAGSAHVRAGQEMVLTFVLTNVTEQPISVPDPDAGTLSLKTVAADENQGSLGEGGHTALAANPGSRDRWTTLEPGKSLKFSFACSWKETGVRRVYCEYYSRSGERPFKPMQTPEVKITVTPPHRQPDGALIAPQFDPIEALAKELNSNPLWPNGRAPNISLASNAAPDEVVTQAVELWGFDRGHIKTYQVREVRPIGLDAKPGCSAALIESDLGRKILLFKYEQHAKTGLWWTRFYDAPEEAASNRPAHGSRPFRSESNRTSSPAGFRR